MLFVFFVLARGLAAQDSATYVIGETRARARSCPYMDCTIITWLEPGTPVDVLNAVEGDAVDGSSQWYHVSLSGLDAYVHTLLVTTTTAPVTASGAFSRATYHFGACVSSRGQRNVYRVIDAALTDYAAQGFDDPGAFAVYADCDLQALAETTCELLCATHGGDADFWQQVWESVVWGMSGTDTSGQGVMLLRMAGPSGVITSTARHELFHIFQQNLSGISVSGAPVGDVYALGPEWLTEGSAQVMACLCTRPLIAHARGVARDISLSDAAPTIGRFQMSNYAFWSLSEGGAAYLVRNHGGLPALKAYYTNLGQGAAWAEAFSTAFEITIDEFYAEFETYRSR